MYYSFASISLQEYSIGFSEKNAIVIFANSKHSMCYSYLLVNINSKLRYIQITIQTHVNKK